MFGINASIAAWTSCRPRSYALRCATSTLPSRPGAAWLRARVAADVLAQRDVRRALDADHELSACRKVLDRRNANPQMVAERALLALHGASQ